VGGICIIRWALFALVLALHISLDALAKPKQSFLHGKDAHVLAHIIIQIPPTEFQNLHIEREVERKKRAQLFVHQVSFSLLFVTPVKRLLRRVRQWYQNRGRADGGA
jgi:hypothetical protein